MNKKFFSFKIFDIFPHTSRIAFVGTATTIVLACATASSRLEVALKFVGKTVFQVNIVYLYAVYLFHLPDLLDVSKEMYCDHFQLRQWPGCSP